MAFLDEEPELYALMIEFWTIWVRDDDLRPRHAERFEAARGFIGSLIQEKADEMGIRDAASAGSDRRRRDGACRRARATAPRRSEAMPHDLFPSVLPLLIQALEQPE